MSRSRKKKPPRPGAPGAADKRGKQRNPFAGRPQSGAGFHSEDKYGKKDRREEKQEIEEEAGEETEELP